MKQKSAYLLIGLAIVLTAIGAYFLGKGDLPLIPAKTPSTQTLTDWQTYDGSAHGYQFQYPADWDTVELSGTLVVGPEPSIEELREKMNYGEGFGAPYMAMQVIVQEQSRLANLFVSDEYQAVVSEPVNVGGVKATKHTITYLQSSPGGDAGTQTETYAIPIPDSLQAVMVSLFDLRYKPLLQQIMATFTVVKPSDSLIGKTVAEVQKQKGKPTEAANNQDSSKTVWVYAGTGDDTTATYVYFNEGKVSQVMTDEYNGTLEGNSWVK